MQKRVIYRIFSNRNRSGQNRLLTDTRKQSKQIERHAAKTTQMLLISFQLLYQSMVIFAIINNSDIIQANAISVAT